MTELRTQPGERARAVELWASGLPVVAILIEVGRSESWFWRQTHRDFVRWLEEREDDIAVPDSASLIELCRDLDAMQGGSVKSAVRAGSDNVDINLVNNTSVASGTVSLPKHITLEIPCFDGDANVQVRALILTLVESGNLFLTYRLLRTVQIATARFDDMTSEIDAEIISEMIYAAAPLDPLAVK